MALRPAARFIGGRADETGRCYATVQTPNGAEQEQLAGSFVLVASTLRLIDPQGGRLSIAAE